MSCEKQKIIRGAFVMDIVSNEKVNFNSLEQNIYKKMMELGRKLIQDE